MSFKNLRLGPKFGAAFAGVVVIVMAMTGGVFVATVGHQRIDDRSSGSDSAQVALERAHADAISSSNQLRGYLVTGDQDARRQALAAEAAYVKDFGDFRRLAAREQTLDAPATRVAILHRDWKSTILDAELAAAAGPGGVAGAAEMARTLHAGVKLAAFEVAIEDLRQATDRWSDRETVEAAQSLRNLQALVAGGAILAAALAAVMGWLLSRAVATPVVQMTEAMRRLAAGDHDIVVTGAGRKDEIGDMAAAVEVFREAAVEKRQIEARAAEERNAADADRARSEAARDAAAREQAAVVASLATALNHLREGDLSSTISEAFPGDYETLRADFNAAIRSLAETVSYVRSGTDSIGAGSDEIAHASDDLSRRTEQQAASLEETAAALDQITATVKKTAAGAREAADTIGRAKDEAVHSGEVVAKAVDAMGQIEKSSQQISQIIGVIDEIAFQTNL
ncbi:MAG: HAMP domain-containing protein, partial [Proteobacteria bacterium]|nr:HAMP domain-containing protein [Pseudomonadota bacterium]